MTFLPHRIVTKTQPRGAGLRTVKQDITPPEYSTQFSDFPDPTVEGEVHLLIVNNSLIATMYVAIEFDGTLEWITVAVTETVSDPRNGGNAWDPRRRFVNGQHG